MKASNGIHHVPELLARVQDSGAKVESALALTESGPWHHAHALKEKEELILESHSFLTLYQMRVVKKMLPY